MDFQLTDEQSEVISTAKKLAMKHAPNQRVTWEEAGTFSWDFLQDLAAHGLTGIDLPESQGGQGQSLLDAVLVIEAVASSAPHLSDAIHATNFGAIRQIAEFAGDRLRQEVLSEILAGRALSTIAMSEPDAGSAIGHLKTRARRSGDQVHVTGQKIFNSLGPFATHFVVWARFGKQANQIGAVVVPADTPGFSRGKDERFISGEKYCTLHFDEAEVPSEYVLLDRDGLQKMMGIFNIERLGNATRSVGLGELALSLATDHVVERTTGGRRLADFQGLRWKLADTRIQLDAARLLIHRAATELSSGGLPDPMYVAMAKCQANEAGFHAADMALQLFGGYGYTTEYPIEYLWKRTRGWMIAGGSVEVLRNRVSSELLKRHGASG